MPTLSAGSRNTLVSLALIAIAVTTVHAPAPAVAGLPRARYVPSKALHALQKQQVHVVGEKTFRQNGRSFKAAVVDPVSLQNLRAEYYQLLGLDPAKVDAELRKTIDRIQVGAAAKQLGIGRKGLARAILGSGIEPTLDRLVDELRAELDDTEGLWRADSGIRTRVSRKLGGQLSEPQVEQILSRLGHGFHNGDVAVFTNATYTPHDPNAKQLGKSFLTEVNPRIGTVKLRYTRGRPEGDAAGVPTHQLGPDVRGLTVHYDDQPDTGTNQPKQITPRGLEFVQFAFTLTGGKSGLGKVMATGGLLWRIAREEGLLASVNPVTNLRGALIALSVPYNFFKGALPVPDVETQHYWGYPLVVGETTADNGAPGVLVARRHYAPERTPQNASNSLGRRLLNAGKALVASRFGFNRTFQTERADSNAAQRSNHIEVLLQFLTANPAATSLLGDGNQAWDLQASPEWTAGFIARPRQESRDRKAESQVRNRIAGPQRGARGVGTFQQDRASAAYPHSANNRQADR